MMCHTEKGPGVEPGSFFLRAYGATRKEAAMSNVTWNDLIQFVIMICAVITVIQNSRKKK